MNAAAPENTARAPPLDPGATVRSPRIPGYTSEDDAPAAVQWLDRKIWCFIMAGL